MNEEMQQRLDRLVLPLLEIHDPQERLAVISTRRGNVPDVPPEERSDALRVPGCVSRVWLKAGGRDGCLDLALAAESAMVRGLAQLTCELYQQYPLAENKPAAVNLPAILKLEGWLTPTRLNGLRALESAILRYGWPG